MDRIKQAMNNKPRHGHGISLVLLVCVAASAWVWCWYSEVSRIETERQAAQAEFDKTARIARECDKQMPSGNFSQECLDFLARKQNQGKEP